MPLIAALGTPAFSMNVIWAVLIVTVVTMVLGFLWYSPILFGKPWMKAMGWGGLTKEQVQAKQQQATPGYIISTLGAIVMALLTWLILGYAGAEGPVEGMVVTAIAWLAYYGYGTVANSFFEGKPFTLWIINSGYFGVVYVAAGAITGWLV